MVRAMVVQPHDLIATHVGSSAEGIDCVDEKCYRKKPRNAETSRARTIKVRARLVSKA
ncbi:hypothetical protein GCM10009860_23370 [Microbacterium mitrae]